MKDDISVVIFFAVIITVVLGLPVLRNSILAPQEQSQVIQFQEGLVSLGVCDTQTRDQLIQANATVRKWQMYNKLWYFAWAVPNSWDSLHTVKGDNKKCYKNTTLNDINVQGTGALVITKETKP